MELTQIEPFGILVLEPVTSLTDLITATVCFFAFYRLRQIGRTEPEHVFFRNYFLLMGCTTVAAGLIGHAFLYMVNFNWKMIGWSFSALAIFSIERSAILMAKPWLSSKQTKWLYTVNVAQLIIFFLVILNPETRSFNAVKTNSAIGLVGMVALLHMWIYRHTQKAGNRQVAIAICLGLLPAITFNGQITLHKWFNYHDISHVLMAMVTFAIYLGAKTLATSDSDFSFKGTKAIQS